MSRIWKLLDRIFTFIFGDEWTGEADEIERMSERLRREATTPGTTVKVGDMEIENLRGATATKPEAVTGTLIRWRPIQTGSEDPMELIADHPEGEFYRCSDIDPILSGTGGADNHGEPYYLECPGCGHKSYPGDELWRLDLPCTNASRLDCKEIMVHHNRPAHPRQGEQGEG